MFMKDFLETGGDSPTLLPSNPALVFPCQLASAQGGPHGFKVWLCELSVSGTWQIASSRDKTKKKKKVLPSWLAIAASSASASCSLTLIGACFCQSSSSSGLLDAGGAIVTTMPSGVCSPQ